MVISEGDSLFVVGDAHGEYDRLLGLLGNAGLVDREGEWLGERSHVVFLGDVFDRGADVIRTLWFLYGLERKARAAGGSAYVMLGNHGTMIFEHDVCYVSAKEKLLARLHGTSYPELFDIRYSVLGRWLVSRPGLMLVNEVLLAHGGVDSGWSPCSVEAANDLLRAFMSEGLFYLWADTTLVLVTDSETARRVADQYSRVIVMDSPALARRTGLLFDENGIFWFQGYVQSDTLTWGLDGVLDEFGAGVHAVAHTPVGSMEACYDGKLLAVDLQRPVTEILLLVWDSDGGRYQRWRATLDGPPELF